MATIVKTPSGKFKALIRKRGRTLKSKTFTRKGDARAWARRIEANQETMQALEAPGASKTFAKRADVYLKAWARRDQSMACRVQFWRDALGHRMLTEIDRKTIRAVLNKYAGGEAMRGDGLDAKGRPRLKPVGRSRSSATVNRMRGCLSGMFKHAIGAEWVEANPVREVPTLTEDNKRLRYLGDDAHGPDELERLLKACQESEWDRLYLLVLMAIGTGARRPDRPYSFRNPWNRARAAARVEGYHFHDLRHTTASYLAMGGATMLQVGAVLGHKSPQSTNRHSHLSTDAKAELTDRVLGELLEDKS